MGCGCSGSSTKPMITKYELTKPNGEVTTYTSDTEARMQRSLAGGGTIRPVREPLPKPA
ncbi:DUF7196 family protein [Nocardia cyriacigeorgica]|uniref:DUF7196 family protein n=1 Tax=Nocardia cyriacigeorgica TaxID=135487 RepID=UPI001486C54B|nr:hypothetical protein [Nocardia cyriacigeorgica]